MGPKNDVLDGVQILHEKGTFEGTFCRLIVTYLRVSALRTVRPRQANAFAGDAAFCKLLLTLANIVIIRSHGIAYTQCIRFGVPVLLHMPRGICVCMLGTRMSCAKTAEPIEMLFGRLTRRNSVC